MEGLFCYTTVMNESPYTPESMLPLDARIDRLYDHIAETRDQVKNSKFNEARAKLKSELKNNYPDDENGYSKLKGIPAWEKLIGGGEYNPDASEEVVSDVTFRVAALVADLESEWEV
tara:strand:- start:537 stop:887 length:351 start_codon:yes stop_codon:yes gene_type:complete